METAQVKQVLEITALYQAAFNHMPDAAGLQYWLNDMANGRTMKEMAALFMQHPDFVAAHPLGEHPFNFINGIYENAFHKPAPSNVMQHWDILFMDAVPKAEMLVAFAEMSIPLVGQPSEHPIWWIT